MLELLFGILIGVGIGTYNHEKTEPCMAPVMDELLAMKERIQGRMEANASARVSNASRRG